MAGLGLAIHTGRARLGLLLATSLLMSACSWHLRGEYQPSSAYQSISLESQTSPELTRILRRQMELRGWDLVSINAAAEMLVEPVVYERRSLTINSQGQVASYELSAELTAEIHHRELGDSRIIVSAVRRFDNDVNRVIATATEEAGQKRAIQNELVERLLLRLGAMHRQDSHEAAQ